MPPRLPTKADLPANVTIDIVPPPSTTPNPQNALLLLHGLGDTQSTFTQLSRALHLPETTCLSICAPHPLPFEIPGYHWGDDIQFNGQTGDLDAASGGVSKAVRLVGERVIGEGLVGRCGFSERGVFVWGFGQGGTVALESALSLSGDDNEAKTTKSLGGVISIGGPLSTPPSPQVASILAGKALKNKTPVLLCMAARGSSISEAEVHQIKKVFEFVEVVKFETQRQGDSMPRNREEMLPIMRFLAGKLRSRKGVPEGAVEVGCEVGD